MIEIAAKVAVFDLDDTLYLERDFARSGFSALARQFGERIGADRFAQACCQLLESGARGDIFDTALTMCGLEPDPVTIAELVARYRDHRPDIALAPDAARLFARMPAIPTGLITDGPSAAQRGKIRALGLDTVIDHIVVTGEWDAGHSKPHPRAFRLLEQLTGCTGDQLVYIADNVAKDFIAPRRLGWQTVQVVRPLRIHAVIDGPSQALPDHTIASLDGLAIEVRA